jgi:hypothetical protein
MQNTSEMTINENFCFDTKKRSSIAVTQKALKLYTDNLEKALKLEGNIPIFLDTNVLLDYYTMSFQEREKLEKFLLEHKERIFVTQQIEKEFLRNRIEKINSFYTSLSRVKNDFDRIKQDIDDFKRSIINKFGGFLTGKILKNDYPELQEELESLKGDLQVNLRLFSESSDLEKRIDEKAKHIEEVVDSILEENKDMQIYDEALEIFATFNTTKALQEDEIRFIESQYDQLSTEYEALSREDKESYLYQYTFPGRSDKNKKDYPYGDFIIYHEILKYCREHQTNAIFLTSDVTKKDWLTEDKKPYVRYIEKTYLNTEHVIFILDAERLLKVSFERIYEEEPSKTRTIVRTIQSIKDDELFREQRKNLEYEEILEKIKSRGYWEIIIQPQEFIRERIQNLGDCKKLIMEMKVSLRGWDFPHYDFRNEPVSGLDYVEQTTDWAGQIEFWRYYQSGQFVFIKGLKEDWIEEDGFLGGNRFGIEPFTMLEIINSVYFYTEVFEFASRLANRGLLGEACKIHIILHKAKHRKLRFLDAGRELYSDYVSEIEEIPYEQSISTIQLLSDSAEMALDAIVWLFQRFNWHEVNKNIFREDQRRFLEKRI